MFKCNSSKHVQFFMVIVSDCSDYYCYNYYCDYHYCYYHECLGIIWWWSNCWVIVSEGLVQGPYTVVISKEAWTCIPSFVLQGMHSSQLASVLCQGSTEKYLLNVYWCIFSIVCIRLGALKGIYSQADLILEGISYEHWMWWISPSWFCQTKEDGSNCVWKLLSAFLCSYPLYICLYVCLSLSSSLCLSLAESLNARHRESGPPDISCCSLS